MGLLDRFRRGDSSDYDDGAPYQRAVSGAAFDHNVTGLDLMQRGLISEAREEFRKGLRHSPDSAELCYNMGVAHDYLAETKKAAEFYERATKLDPEFVEAFCGLGTAYSKLGKGLEAIRACIQAIRLQPSHLDAHNALALAYFHWGSYPEADRKSTRLNSSHEWISR